MTASSCFCHRHLILNKHILRNKLDKSIPGSNFNFSMLAEYVSAMGKLVQFAEQHNVDVHMLSDGPTPPDPAQRRLPPNPAKPSAGAGEIKPSTNAGEEENASEREEERREITSGVADIGA